MAEDPNEIYELWNQGAELFNAQRNWIAQNREQNGGELDWGALRKAEEEHGWPGYYDPLSFHQGVRTWRMRLPQHRKNSFVKRKARYAIQCATCQKLFTTEKVFGVNHISFCSDKCKEVGEVERIEAKRERRRERAKERSEALANREGVCLVCKAPMRVSRVTKKTCSERCKKALQRHPEAYPLPTVEAPSEEDIKKVMQAGLAVTLARLGGKSVSCDALEERERGREWVKEARKLRRLANLREEAPAIYLKEVMDRMLAESR